MGLVSLAIVVVAGTVGFEISRAGPHAVPGAGASTPAPATTLPTAVPGPLTEPLQAAFSFTETESGGISFSGTLSLGTPEQYDPAEIQGELSAGSPCTIDPHDDAVIPGRLTLENTTPNLAAWAEISFTWPSGHEYEISAIEAGFGDGPSCITAPAGTGDGQLDVGSTAALAPDGYLEVDLFLVVPDGGVPASVTGGDAGPWPAELWLASSIAPDTGQSITPTSLTGWSSFGDGASDNPFTIPVGG